MTNVPKISVIMAVFNDEKFINQSIESIINQTFSDFEFIIFDNGSSDHSRKMIIDWAYRDQRIRYVLNQTNIGLTKCLNQGLRMARGQFIARMDGDDISLPDRFQKQVQFLEKDPTIFLVGSNAIKIDERDNIITNTKLPIDAKQIKKQIVLGNCLIHPSIMFRHNKSYFYREKFYYAQDYDFFLILMSANLKIANINEPLIKYRINSASISYSKQSKQKLFALKAKEFYYQRKNTGFDSYDQFDPETILNIDPRESMDQVVLASEIKSAYKGENYSLVRFYTKRYFQIFGYSNIYLFYFILSFLPTILNRTIRRIIQK